MLTMAKPWLTEEEKRKLLDMIARNDALDIIGTGNPNDPPNVRYGEQWYAMLLFQRCSTGVSMRDTTHGIMQPIAINQSLPYRIFNYQGEQNIEFGVPAFPKNLGCIPIYLEKTDATGPYADLVFLGPDCKFRNEHGFITDNVAAVMYAEQHGGGVGPFFAALQMRMFTGWMRGQDRALSGHEAFPLGLYR
jgi:hypothetical protein